LDDYVAQRLKLDEDQIMRKEQLHTGQKVYMCRRFVDSAIVHTPAVIASEPYQNTDGDWVVHITYEQGVNIPFYLYSFSLMPVDGKWVTFSWLEWQ